MLRKHSNDRILDYEYEHEHEHEHERTEIVVVKCKWTILADLPIRERARILAALRP